MRRTALVALAVAGVLSTATPALADPPIADGLLCQFASIQDPLDPGMQTGEFSVGPAHLTEADGTTPEDGTLVCTIQVDVSDHTGDGPAVHAHGTGWFGGQPYPFYLTSYEDGANVYLCAEFTDDSDNVTYFWDDSLGEWSTDITVPCGRATGSTEPGEEKKYLDSLVCPILAILFPPNGDVGNVWDCPPYDDSGVVPGYVAVQRTRSIFSVDPDALICPILSNLFPPYGDVGFQDCPPYDSAPPRGGAATHE